MTITPSDQNPTADIGPVSWVTEYDDLEFLFNAIANASAVVIDLETTGLDMHAVTGGKSNGGVAARIAFAALTLPQRDAFGNWNGDAPVNYAVPLSHISSPWRGQWRTLMREIARLIVKAEAPVVNQNMKFDARWIYATTGIDLAHLIYWDTQVSSHLLDENAPTALKKRAPETFGIPPWNENIDFSQPGAAETIDLYTLGDYAVRDTYWTWRLFEHHRNLMFLTDTGEIPQADEEFETARLGKLATWVAMPTVKSLTKIEQNGFRIDVPWVEEKLEEEERTSKDAIDLLAERYGQDRASASMAATSKWFQEFTQRAVDAGELRVGALTPSGAPQWSKSVLSRQARAGSEVAQLVLAARGATKRAEYLRSWLSVVTPSGFIHSTYWPGRVMTGRLSSSDPNMQQVTYALRPAFIPRDGYVIADFDYSQIELRVAAFISRCEPMMQAFRDDADLHSMIAAQIAGKPIDDVTKAERQQGKAANFGLLYGMGAAGFVDYADTAYNVQVSFEEAQTIRNDYFKLWDGLQAWHDRSIAEARQRGQVVSPLGRVRRVPAISSGNSQMQNHAERQAINSPVQGMASDLLQMSAASVQGFLYDSTPIDGINLVATVHDSIVGEVEESRWQEVCEQVTERMTHLDRVLAKMGVEFDVPLRADANVGTRWGMSDVGTL